MEAFKVTTLDQMGFDYGEKYYFDIKQAENDFYNRLAYQISENENLAEAEDIDYLDTNSPWRIETNIPHREHIIIRAFYLVWDEWCTQDGCESDIKQEEIIIEKIEIS